MELRKQALTSTQKSEQRDFLSCVCLKQLVVVIQFQSVIHTIYGNSADAGEKRFGTRFIFVVPCKNKKSFSYDKT
jgi:hypothetical protein